MFCVCSHSHGRVGTAWQRSSACGVCFECSPFVCVSGSVLSAFQTFWARYSPATTPTCQLTCSSSCPSLRSSFCLSLLFGPSLRADEWPPRWWGDNSCNCLVSPSLTEEFGGGGDVMRRKGTQWALFYMICGHSVNVHNPYASLDQNLNFYFRHQLKAEIQIKKKQKTTTHVTCQKDASQKGGNVLRPCCDNANVMKFNSTFLSMFCDCVCKYVFLFLSASHLKMLPPSPQ